MILGIYLIRFIFEYFAENPRNILGPGKILTELPYDRCREKRLRERKAG
jgi:hypothetical protein